MQKSQRQNVSKLGGGGGEGQEGTCNVTVRELCLGLKTISIR